jgi:glycine oxidase
MKILIVGAGVAGLAIGWRLSEAGMDVEILERGIAGRGATWASAGMISPGAELGRESGKMAVFARKARALWPDFAKELEEVSGHSISYAETGSLLVAEDASRARVLKERAEMLLNDGIAAKWLTQNQLRAHEPLLSTALFGALHIAVDAQVDNRALSDALSKAFAKAGGRLRERCAMRSLVIEGGAVRAVATSEGVISADRIVLACGAWTNLIGGIAQEDLPPVKPAKGQMMACEPPSSVSLPRAPIWSEAVYLVPRKERLFIGATVEDAGIDTSVSREARDFLLQAATLLIPTLGSWRVAEMWAGLRPRTPDDAPVLGPAALEGLYVASGQFRNGILFAPAVAERLRQLILEGAENSSGNAFDPRRFSHM